MLSFSSTSEYRTLHEKILKLFQQTLARTFECEKIACGIPIL
jgi:hypothetical protein